MPTDVVVAQASDAVPTSTPTRSETATRSRFIGRRYESPKDLLSTARQQTAKLAARCADHQTHEGFGHVRFEPFGVAFTEAHHVGDHASVAPTWIRPHLRRAGTRVQAPRLVRLALAQRVVDIARLGVDDVVAALARPRAVLVGPR